MNSSMVLQMESLRTPIDEMAELAALIEREGIESSLGAFVAERAETLGDEVAAHWFEQSDKVTYRQLHERSDRLASSLLKLGVRFGSHVGTMLQNTSEFPITWFALAKLGAVMVPINPSYTPREISFVLSQADVDWVIVDESFCARMDEAKLMLAKPIAGEIVAGRSERSNNGLGWNELVAAGALNFSPPYKVTGDAVLNIQFTSGTTGSPKGCVLTQDYWLVMSTLSFFKFKVPEIENCLVWAPFFYMDGQRKFVEMMRNKITMFIPSAMSLTKLLGWVREYKINYTALPEVALRKIPRRSSDKETPLKFVDCYGWSEASRQEVQERFNVQARDTYGMTEIGVQTFMPLSASDMARTRSCGLLAPFGKLRVVREDGSEAEPGEVGELWASGRSLMLGYYRRPDANASSFEGEWFRTGDLFYKDENGYFFFINRIKDMIRRAGENISAFEVESVLRQMDDIEDVAVIAVADDERLEEVKAFVKFKSKVDGAPFDPTKILAHSRSSLANFKCPRFLAYVDDFPRTPSGKIEKKQLRSGSWDTYAEFDMRGMK